MTNIYINKQPRILSPLFLYGCHKHRSLDELLISHHCELVFLRAAFSRLPRGGIEENPGMSDDSRLPSPSDVGNSQPQPTGDHNASDGQRRCSRTTRAANSTSALQLTTEPCSSGGSTVKQHSQDHPSVSCHPSAHSHDHPPLTAS